MYVLVTKTVVRSTLRSVPGGIRRDVAVSNLTAVTKLHIKEPTGLQLQTDPQVTQRQELMKPTEAELTKAATTWKHKTEEQQQRADKPYHTLGMMT